MLIVCLMAMNVHVFVLIVEVNFVQKMEVWKWFIILRTSVVPIA